MRTLATLIFLGACALAVQAGRNKYKTIQRCFGRDVVDKLNQVTRLAEAKCSGEDVPEMFMKSPAAKFLKLLGGSSKEGSSEEKFMQGDVNIKVIGSLPSSTLLQALKIIKSKGKYGKMKGGRRGGYGGSSEEYGRGGGRKGGYVSSEEEYGRKQYTKRGRGKGREGGYSSSEEEYGMEGKKRGRGGSRKGGYYSSEEEYGMGGKKRGRGDYGGSEEYGKGRSRKGGYYSSEEEYGMGGEKRGRGGSRGGDYGGSEEEYGPGSDGDEFVWDGLMNVISKLTKSMGNYRNKRQTTSEDSLTTILETQEEYVKEKMANKTCMMRELQMIDADGNISLQGKLDFIDALGIRDEWLVEKLKLSADSCYKRTMAVPAEHLALQVDEKYGRVKMFKNCFKDTQETLCKRKDVKKEMEKKFGSFSKLVEESGLNEGTMLEIASEIVNKGVRAYAI